MKDACSYRGSNFRAFSAMLKVYTAGDVRWRHNTHLLKSEMQQITCTGQVFLYTGAVHQLSLLWQAPVRCTPPKTMGRFSLTWRRQVADLSETPAENGALFVHSLALRYGGLLSLHARIAYDTGNASHAIIHNQYTNRRNHTLAGEPGSRVFVSFLVELQLASKTRRA